MTGTKPLTLTIALVMILVAASFANAAPDTEENYSYQIYGSYNLGCISKTIELPRESPDYQLQFYGPARNFGHPSLIAYLEGLIARTKQAGLPPLLIGDLSKPNGGPFGPKSNHGSHATGLDVDIPFEFASPRKTEAQLARPKDRPIVNNKGPNANFTADIVLLIRLAAQDEKVERIFVNPRIKQHLCRILQGEDRNILNKLRPWFGHRAHMHVRLSCPDDSPYCKRQAQVPQGDGCAETETWFLPPAKGSANQKQKPAQKPVLPEQCKDILGVKN